MVYTGLSLFIIRWAYVYLVVCILTHITLHLLKDSIFGNNFPEWYSYAFGFFKDSITFRSPSTEIVILVEPEELVFVLVLLFFPQSVIKIEVS